MKKAVAEYIEKACEEQMQSKRTRTRSSTNSQSEFKHKIRKIKHRVDCWNTPVINDMYCSTLNQSRRTLDRNANLTKSVHLISNSMMQPLTFHKEENQHPILSTKKDRQQPSARNSNCDKFHSQKVLENSVERQSSKQRTPHSGMKTCLSQTKKASTPKSANINSIRGHTPNQNKPVAISKTPNCLKHQAHTLLQKIDEPAAPSRFQF